MSVYRRHMPASPAARIFGTFRRWPLVPSADLYRLQAALTQCAEAAGSDSADQLLTLVKNELKRRDAEGTNLRPRSDRTARAAHAIKPQPGRGHPRRDPDGSGGASG